MTTFMAIYRPAELAVRYLLFIIFIPILFVAAIGVAIIAWVFLPAKNTKNMLTEESLTLKLNEWIEQNKATFKLIERKIPEKNYYSMIELTPVNDEVLPISFVIGGQLLLIIEIGKYSLTFETDFLNSETLDAILGSYLSGDYYILQRKLDDQLLESIFHIKSEKKYYKIHEQQVPVITFIERKAAKVEKIHFPTLAVSNGIN